MVFCNVISRFSKFYLIFKIINNIITWKFDAIRQCLCWENYIPTDFWVFGSKSKELWFLVERTDLRWGCDSLRSLHNEGGLVPSWRLFTVRGKERKSKRKNFQAHRTFLFTIDEIFIHPLWISGSRFAAILIVPSTICVMRNRLADWGILAQGD